MSCARDSIMNVTNHASVDDNDTEKSETDELSTIVQSSTKRLSQTENDATPTPP